ncbi:PTS system transporter subunit IIA [Streptococcus pneumoniae]|nr:PTS system transporter subunit IIA [Streptococcus pneumoniae]
MVLDYFFDKNLVFCLEADNQEQLFDQVASLLEEREIVTPTYREALITREKSFPTGLDMEFLGKDLPNVAIPQTNILAQLMDFFTGNGHLEDLSKISEPEKLYAYIAEATA